MSCKAFVFGDHIGLDETNEVEFKNCVPDTPTIAKNIMAFANSNGGKIYLGIRDDGVIKGITPNKKLSVWKDEFRLKIDGAVGMLLPKYKEHVNVSFHEVSSRGNQLRFIIVLNIPKSDVVYSFASGEKYVRREASVAKITDTSVKSNLELSTENKNLQTMLQILEDKRDIEKILEKLAMHRQRQNSLSFIQQLVMYWSVS